MWCLPVNNNIYTTITPELEDLSIMTPEEKLQDHANTFLPEDDPIWTIDLFRIQNGIAATFHETGYHVEIASRPINGNLFHCTHGLETPKDEVTYLTDILDKFHITYTVRDGAFKNTSGRWTNKRFAFVELHNGIKDYYTLYSKTDEIPYLVGDVII